MNILIVYSGFTRRPTLLEGLLAFEKYSNHNVFYLNSRLPSCIQGISKTDIYDIIIFSTLFFSRRTEKANLIADFRSVRWIKSLSAVKVVTPQDEYINSKYVNEFIDDFAVKLVFSVQPQIVWNQVYPHAADRGFEIKQILTGYIDDDLADRVSRDQKWTGAERQVDIGYRTTGVPPAWYGRHAKLKEQIAEEFLGACSNTNLKLDINCSASKTISNESWYDFLGNCRYTIGTEGGTSILDYDGSIKDQTESYLSNNPKASFSEIERNCFAGKDGNFLGYALSPRHLEACLTRTAQILVQGEYSGVLTPWVHYIPLKSDFSNIHEVINLLSDDELRIDLINRCYSEIVLSGKYKVSSLVKHILDSSTFLVKPFTASETDVTSVLNVLRVINRPGGIIFVFIDALRAARSFFYRVYRRMQ
jgi:hypothetical protein